MKRGVVAIVIILALAVNGWAGWQKHTAPAPVWQMAPRIQNNRQTGLYLACQNEHVYAVDNENNIQWSFDMKSLARTSARSFEAGSRTEVGFTVYHSLRATPRTTGRLAARRGPGSQTNRTEKPTAGSHHRAPPHHT